MPRPSLKSERRVEIIDAIERCVIRDGINGATLEKIAEEANMRRSLLRHNIGNREQLIEALLNRFFTQSDLEVQTMIDLLPDTRRTEMLLCFLFDDEYTNSQLSLLALALTSASFNQPTIRERMKQWNEDFIIKIASILELSYPTSAKKACYEVAAGLVGIYFNSESLTPLGDMSSIRNASKKAAERLLSTLGESI